MAWLVCIERYASLGGGAYNDGIFAPLLLAAVGLTFFAGVIAVQAWKGRSSAVAAAATALPAIVLVLVLALAISLRG